MIEVNIWLRESHWEKKEIVPGLASSMSNSEGKKNVNRYLRPTLVDVYCFRSILGISKTKLNLGIYYICIRNINFPFVVFHRLWMHLILNHSSICAFPPVVHDRTCVRYDEWINLINWKWREVGRDNKINNSCIGANSWFSISAWLLLGALSVSCLPVPPMHIYNNLPAPSINTVYISFISCLWRYAAIPSDCNRTDKQTCMQGVQ